MKKIIEAAKKIATEWRRKHKEANEQTRRAMLDTHAERWQQKAVIADAVAMSWEGFVKELTTEDILVDGKKIGEVHQAPPFTPPPIEEDGG